jgi:hypothetical protein
MHHGPHLLFSDPGNRADLRQPPRRLWLLDNRNPDSKGRSDVVGETCIPKTGGPAQFATTVSPRAWPSSAKLGLDLSWNSFLLEGLDPRRSIPPLEPFPLSTSPGRIVPRQRETAIEKCLLTPTLSSSDEEREAPLRLATADAWRIASPRGRLRPGHDPRAAIAPLSARSLPHRATTHPNFSRRYRHPLRPS